MKKLYLLLVIIAAFSLSSCQKEAGAYNAGNAAIESPVSTPEPVLLTTQTASTIPPTPTKDLINTICSPLEGLSLEELISDPTVIQQVFKTPRLGLDDGHTGIDYAYYRRGDRVAIEGLPVYSVLPGRVISILDNKWPLGNTIIIETPLEEIDEELILAISPPQIAPTVEPAPHVICPPGEMEFEADASSRSIYILYAHLKDPAYLIIGEDVECGQKIGEVGNSGSSSNPHLHLETRIGPSGARFESMAYYTTAATTQEQYNYCVWRVSNLFQLFDPLNLLSANFD
jgi:murein DD-endopeptidase MepM/ murein hydrolase activator NlpD